MAVWDRHEPPTDGDTISFVSIEDQRTLTCHAAELFRDGKRVRIHVGDNDEYITRVALADGTQHVCSMQTNNCIRVGATAAECSLHQIDDGDEGVIDAPAHACR